MKLAVIYVTLSSLIFFSDAGSVTWYEPPPVETTPDPDIELTADNQQFLEGSTHVQLSWNFSLTPDLSLSSVILRLNGVHVAAVVLLSGTAGVLPGFEGRFNITWISQRVTLIIFNVTGEDDGELACQLNTFQGLDSKVWNRKMKVEVLVETSFTSSPSSPSGNQTVNEGSNLTLFCDATGKPTPNVTWTRVLKNGTDGDVVFFGNPWVIVNISRTATGTHRCTANNGIGNPVSHSLYINVTYRPAVTKEEGHIIDVSEGSSASIPCPVLGNPRPSITWYRGNDTSSGTMINTNHTLEFSYTVLKDSGWYTCFAQNSLGNVTFTVQLRVAKPSSTPSTSSKPTTEVVTGNSFLMTLTVTNKGCDDNPSVICEQMGEKVKKEIAGQLESVTVKNCKCGSSVTAYLSLDFTQRVKIPEVLSVLKKAAEGSGFGEFQVDPGSIQAISDDQLPTVSSPSTVGTPTSDGNKGKDLWIIIGASVGGVIVLVVVVVVAWCVHHKRKCRRKGSKVRCSESEAFAPGEDNGSGHVNNGYADAGPRPTAMEGMSQHQGASAVPTYATVDKSAKKGSKKDKVEEQKPQAEAPQYAAVDKSKKKKKEEPEATYAQVDKSKKSKKKPKPGEVLYADLGDFQQMQELPRVSTSPQALPPIKKPTTYVETQYADITQFLKGDVTLPDSNNSQGPATGSKAAPAPENSNSQEPGTNTKKTSRASNPGGDGGPGHETNF